ncbi:MAG: protease modulator HflC [Salaquimonas sp.]
MSRSPIVLILLAVLAFLGLNSFFVVNEREQSIVIRFGEIKRVEKEPGLYFKLPFTMFDLETVQIIDDRLLRFDLDNITVQVSGGKFYLVNAFVTYKIADAARFRGQVSGQITLAEDRLRTRLNAALRKSYGLRGFEAALSEERSAMMREVRDELRPAASELGIQIEDVRIRRTDLTEEVSEQTYSRMSAERLAEAERLRARGSEAAQRIKARADREVVEIEAAAQRDGEILRGEGEGERNAIFADAYNRDAEFFEFYRSMNAYREALEKSGTTMVLSPNSDFFRYFGNPGGQTTGNSN